MNDVVIVGGGPAGCALALRLARSGLSVALLERCRFPRTKVCGEFLSPMALASLAELGFLERVRRVAHPIRSIALSAFGSSLVRLRLPGEGALSMARSVLDALLLEAARAAGARCIHGAYLNSSSRGSDIDVVYRDVEGRSQTLRARVLVGADGAWSSVAQRAGMTAAPKAGVGRWAMGGHLREALPGDELEMYVGPGGYYALNPIGQRLSNAMLVMPRPLEVHEADGVVSSLTGGRHRFDPTRLERKLAVGPLSYQPQCVARGRILLTGDAAGLLDPFTGQGVALAVQLSRAAARAVVDLLAGRSADATANTYIRQRRAVVWHRKTLSQAVDFIIRTSCLRNRALRRVRDDPSIAEAVLGALVGDTPQGKSAFSARTMLRLIA